MRLNGGFLLKFIEGYIVAEQKNSVDDVFGINRDLPLNYVERDSADNILVNNLAKESLKNSQNLAK